jgi:hypothetical protein
MKHLQFHFYRTGFWIKLCGHGISVSKTPLLFSERYGHIKPLRIGAWRIIYLPNAQRPLTPTLILALYIAIVFEFCIVVHELKNL